MCLVFIKVFFNTVFFKAVSSLIPVACCSLYEQLAKGLFHANISLRNYYDFPMNSAAGADGVDYCAKLFNIPFE